MHRNILVQSADPNRPWPTQAPIPGLEYRVAVPMWGPWYQSSWARSDLGPESYYNPRSYPAPVYNPYIPRRSGAFIQPGQYDPVAFEITQGNPLSGTLSGSGMPTTEDFSAVWWIRLGALALGVYVLHRFSKEE